MTQIAFLPFIAKHAEFATRKQIAAMIVIISQEQKMTIMGKIGKTIIKLDIAELVENLNKALSEEWLACYQYWVGARVVKGPMRKSIEAELKEHAKEEYSHAEKIAERIVQLGGTPVLDPQEWFKITTCKYYPPENPCAKEILKQNLASERCAIRRYQEIADKTMGKDHVTFRIAESILEDELEHENEIETWLEELDTCECHK